VPARPTVAVIVPFAGPEAQLRELLEALAALDLDEGDEVLVADNRRHAQPERDAVARVVPAAGPRSPAFARNAAAARARADWLVFLDADVRPTPGLLGAYFDPPPGERVGVLGGSIRDVAARDTAVARYVVARAMMDQGTTLGHPHRAFVQTANCAVRRVAFEAVGGFAPAVRAAEDADLCWRLQDAGWTLELRPGARVEHRSRASLGALLRQLAVHGAGAAWLNRRHPGADPPPPARSLVRRPGHYGRRAARAWRRGDRDAVRFALIELLSLYAFDLGRLLPNGRDR
jgi:mycofactocin glycosyltransferase